MSETNLTVDPDGITRGDYIETVTEGGVLSDDETKAGVVKEIVTEHNYALDADQTFVVLTDGNCEHRIEVSHFESEDGPVRITEYVDKSGDEDENEDEPELVTDGGTCVTAATTDDLDSVERWAGRYWGDGGYGTTPETIQRAIYQTAIDAGGLVGVDEYASVQNEGYMAALSVSVWVPDPEDYEWRVAEALDETITTTDWDLDVHGGGTGDEVIEEFRAAADGLLDHETVKMVIEHALTDWHDALNAALVGGARDEETAKDLVQTTVKTVERKRYDGSTKTVDIPLADYLRDLHDVYPETRSLHRVMVRVNLGAVDPYFG